MIQSDIFLKGRMIWSYVVCICRFVQLSNILGAIWVPSKDLLYSEPRNIRKNAMSKWIKTVHVSGFVEWSLFAVVTDIQNRLESPTSAPAYFILNSLHSCAVHGVNPLGFQKLPDISLTAICYGWMLLSAVENDNRKLV